MTRLSSAIENLRSHYEIVVVGSGYGGAIAASRLARAGRQVCLLERGKEFQPGEYPDTWGEAASEIQIDGPEGRIGSRTGLYDFRSGEDITAVMGCGLGGTSLVNANVCLRADARVFDDPRWPQGIRDDLGTLVEEGYRRADEMLKPAPLPQALADPPKLAALREAADALGKTCYRVPLAVTFTDHRNHVGVEQRACALCGDCVTGCNYGAKNTLAMNYLPDARNHGAEIFTQASVRSLERVGGRWLVHYELLSSGQERFGAPPMFLTADLVVLAAGTFGTTEILLRSAANGLPLSRQLGERFTGNGDVVAFSYNSDQEIHGVGWGQAEANARPPIGPCITGAIDCRNTGELDEGMVIQEGVIPGALATFLPAAMAVAAQAFGKDTDQDVVDLVKERGRELESLIRGPYQGATRNTLTYLVMAHDLGDGRLVLDDDRVRVRWPGVGKQAVFPKIGDALEKATRSLGGTYLRNPLWTKLFAHDLITVQPLGGAAMGDDAARGVANDKGQVFSGEAGTEVYESLYVCDGAAIPRPLGVNPLLTISALAERCCALIARDRGWIIDYTLPSAPPAASPGPPRLGIEFTERMRGFISTTVTGGYEAAARQGKREGSELSFTLTITSDDLEHLLSDPGHEARIVGTVTAPALSDEPMTVTDGAFNLFVPHPDRVGTHEMRYRMTLATREGQQYAVVGFKTIHDDPGELDMWNDATTLYVTVHEGDHGAVAARGILVIRFGDLPRQMATIKVTNAERLEERLEATARFGRFFCGTLFDRYGGVAARPTVLDAGAPPRKKRPLRVSAPQVHPFRTGDGVELLLTRYQGGAKGPVVLSHGLGVSSKIFSIDTIDTNLLEYLYAHGYDVWLLDYRASSDLPAARDRSTADDVATQDYPAALATVRTVTGASSVQMIAHCVGSITFFMAMLSGLQGVRSAICSQVATHMVRPRLPTLQALYAPAVLRALRINSLTAYVDDHADWLNRLYNRKLRLLPLSEEERCTSAVCRRITFMYSLLYEHDQLNTATHDALHEMFGVANTGIFEHLGQMVRAGKLVAADGSDVYLPHLERLAIPIAFVHGAENACFLPETTKLTYELLQSANGRHLYTHHLVPNYGHIDCIYGKNAVRDVYPLMLRHLEATNA